MKSDIKSDLKPANNLVDRDIIGYSDAELHRRAESLGISDHQHMSRTELMTAVFGS